MAVMSSSAGQRSIGLERRLQMDVIWSMNSDTAMIPHDVIDMFDMAGLLSPPPWNITGEIKHIRHDTLSLSPGQSIPGLRLS
jgi:hypothetical protein